MSCIEEKFARIRAAFPDELKASLVMPFLRVMLDEKKHLTELDAVYIADYLGLPHIQVKETLSWYSMFHQKPTGRHVIKICRNIACSLNGSERLVKYISEKLGIQPGETTPDNRFTLLLAECLASCGSAPVMQLDNTYYEELSEESIDLILEECV